MANPQQNWLEGLITDLGTWILIPLIMLGVFLVMPFVILLNLVRRIRYKPLADEHVQEAGNQILARFSKER